MGSDRISWLLAQDAPSGLQFASVVMTAPRLRKLAKPKLAKSKLAKLMRDTCPSLRQHPLGGGNHVGCRNVAHAAMVVHGADRTVAGLARHHGLGLHRRGKAVQRSPMIGAGGAEDAPGRRPQGAAVIHPPRFFAHPASAPPPPPNP